MSVAGKSTSTGSAAIKVEAVQPVALYDVSTGLPASAGGGGATGPGTAASAGRVTYASDGATVPVTQGVQRAGTDKSGTATTTSGGLFVAANPNRASLVGQNVGTVNIGFHEHNGTAVIGQPGTYTVPPGSSFSASGLNRVNFIAASGTAAVTMTET